MSARAQTPPAEQKARELLDALAARPTRDISIREELAPYPELAQVIFRGATLRDMDLCGQDLRGLDFTGANLIGAQLDGTRVAEARFDQARIELRQLAAAKDWTEHLERWTPPPGRRGIHVVAGDRFALAPFAPEMRVLPTSLTRGSGQPEGITDDEWQALTSERLAMSITPVPNWQVAFGQHPRRGAGAASTVTGRRPCVMTVGDARQYLGWLRDKVVADFRVPSVALLQFLIEAEGGANEDVVALETDPGARAPLPPEKDERFGHGRTNAFGIQDMIGNTSELAADMRDGSEMTDGWPDRPLAVGGAFWQRLARTGEFNRAIAAGANPGVDQHGLRLILILPAELLGAKSR